LPAYAFRVPQEKSEYWFGTGSNRLVVACEGTFYLDPDTADLVTLIVNSSEPPEITGACIARTTVHYSRTEVNGSDMLLPTQSLFEFEGRLHALNSSVYSDCRLRERGTDPIALNLPEGLPFEVVFTGRISINSAAGDTIPAKLATPIQDSSKHILVPSGTSKGAALHRRSGLLFVYAMLTMGISGSILALRQSLTNANVLGGLMSAYLVITALTTVRPVSAWTQRLNSLALLVATVLTLSEIGMGLRALSRPGGTINGVPLFMLFFLATVTGVAAVGDVRMMWSGPLGAAARLARHLWRMCFALFIAAGSFFSIRQRVAKILPEPLTTPAMRAIPIALVFAVMFYWLWRVRTRRTLTEAR